MDPLPPAVTALADRLADTGWVRDLWVAGSLATGDYVSGVSDLDLVAVVGDLSPARRDHLVALHRALSPEVGCVYVEERHLLDAAARHPTWTHGQLVHRGLSGITRAELVGPGFSVFGRSPADLLPPMTTDDVRSAARSELDGYWAWAARRPYLWSEPTFVDLSLTSMARGRHTLRTGDLLTKSAAVEVAHAPGWLIDQVRARRSGEAVASPRLRAGWIGWRDVVVTTRRRSRAQNSLRTRLRSSVTWFSA